MTPEHLWTPEQLRGIRETHDTMRRLRTAASNYLGIQGIINKMTFFNNAETINPKNKDLVLLDAEKLGTTMADFVASRLTNTSDGKKELEEWQDTLSSMKSEYKQYKVSTYSKTNIIGATIALRLRNLKSNPNIMLNWDLTINNNLGAGSIDELIEKDIGIISPLSTDYLIVTSYSSYLMRARDRSFMVKPAALNQDLTKAALPKESGGNRFFEKYKEIGVFIDTTNTGKTGERLYNSVKKEYQDKVVYKPPSKYVLFTPTFNAPPSNKQLPI
jgi:hypothetical protein